MDQPTFDRLSSMDPDEFTDVLGRVNRQSPDLDPEGTIREFERHVALGDATAPSRGRLTQARANLAYDKGVPRFQRILDDDGVEAAYRTIEDVYRQAGQQIHPELQRLLREHLEEIWRVRLDPDNPSGGGLSIHRAGRHPARRSSARGPWGGGRE